MEYTTVSKDLYLLSAAEATKEIKAGRLKAVDLALSCIERIRQVEPKIRAWAYFDEGKVMAQAEAVDEKIKKNEPVGPLTGALVGIKDIFNTVDMPTGMGSPIWEGFAPGNDARVVTYIRWADGIIAGKTVTAEFAVHYPGPTVNPHNFAYTPGTSSSGSAAAVASYMVPLALGTQTAGSTIRPASYCGIYGFKPSFGLLPRTGALKTIDTLDHVTLFARSVEDIHLLFDTLRVKGQNYPFIHRYMDESLPEKNTGSSSWKVAFVKTPAWNCAERYAQEAVVNFVSKLSSDKQIKVEKLDLPEGFDKAHEVHDLIYNKALSYYFKEEYERYRDKISKVFSEMVENGRRITLEEYRRGLEKQRQLIHELDKFLEEHDCIITLSAAGEAPKGLHAADQRDSCLIWTLCYTPSLNLPIFKGPQGLPFGAQIVSRRFRDYRLLDFARYLKEKDLLKDWRGDR